MHQALKVPSTVNTVLKLSKRDGGGLIDQEITRE